MKETFLVKRKAPFHDHKFYIVLKKAAFVLAVVLLLFNGTAAVYGGWLLMADPTGQALQLPRSALDHTPFANFLLPGIVLFVCMGVFSFTALAALLTSVKNHSLYVMAEGGLLTGWIVIQALWTQMYHPWQAVMGAAGLLLILCGWLLQTLNGKTKHVHA